MSDYHKWSEAEKEYLREIAPGKFIKDIVPLMKEKFNYEYGYKKIKTAMNRYGILNGVGIGFKKGHKPAKTAFKKGVPNKTRLMPLFTERVGTDGYIVIKIAEPNVWMSKHKYLYEQKYGKISKDDLIIFLDGDRSNVTLDNLMAITKRESFLLNKYKLRGTKEETTTGILIVKLMIMISDRKKELKEMKRRK